MPSIDDMKPDDDLFRATVTYVLNVDTYDYNARRYTGIRENRTRTDNIGPYKTTAPIKSFIGKVRRRHKDVLVGDVEVKVMKVSGWEEVSL